MLKIFEKIFGSANDRYLKSLQPHVQQINELEDDIRAMSDEELQQKTPEFKRKLDNGAEVEDFLHEAFAVVREVGRRFGRAELDLG
ncbi:MAG: hypothetical protein ABEN55_23295, partial [Bradymonadaceae bacterium]